MRSKKFLQRGIMDMVKVVISLHILQPSGLNGKEKPQAIFCDSLWSRGKDDLSSVV